MIYLLTLMFVCSAYFLPASQLIRPEYFFVSVFGVGALVFNRGISSTFNREIKLFCWLIVFAALSILGQLIFGDGFFGRDLMILVRLFVYLSAILAGGYCGLKIKSTKLLRLLLVVLILLSVVISFIQYFNLFGLNKIIVPIYDSNDDLLITGMSWRRIFGTLGNPNYWGLWLSICFVSVGYYTVIRRRIISSPLFILLFLCIVMTGSRTSLLASIVGLFFGWSFINSNKNKSLGGFLASAILLFFLITALYVGHQTFTSLYYENKGRFDLANTLTLELRMRHWSNFLAEVLEQPYKLILGRGPSKANEIIFGDNMYLLIFRDFGPFALITYILLWYRIMSNIYSQLNNQAGVIRDSLSIAFLISVAFAVFDLAADGWFNVRLAIPLLFGYGFVIMKSRELFYSRSSNG